MTKTFVLVGAWRIHRSPGPKECQRGDDLGDCVSRQQARQAVVWGGGSAREMGANISAGGGPVKLNKSVWLQGTGPGGGEAGKSAAVERRLLVCWSLNLL